MDLNPEKIRLQQVENIKSLFKKVSMAEMVTVYYSDIAKKYNHGIHCALIPDSEVQKSLTSISWDLSDRDGYPETNIHYENGVKIPVYYRYGFNRGIEPLIYDRSFHDIRPNYREINEEFRLFHNLFYDDKEKKYIKILNNGVEEVVAVVEDNRIQIRLKEICQFLAIKEMHLSIQFDYREHSQQPLEQLELSPNNNIGRYKDLECWNLSFRNANNLSFKGCSWLCGKRMIAPLEKSKSGLWGFAQEEPKKYEDFIIGIDEYGDEITHSANPDLLANRFRATSESPHYLTAVQFHKSVLDKYYNLPSKFSFQGDYLSCGSLWRIQIDNEHPDKVCAWLGDLGRDLPYEEQKYWRSYNFAPVGHVSEVYHKRQILAEFADSNRPDIIFRERYNSLKETCSQYLEHQILLPLSKEDSHRLPSIRLLSTEEQNVFDELILSLAIILIDSLNEKYLKIYMPNKDLTTINNSISYLEKVCQIVGIKNYEEHITFLRDLQQIRSSGVAHRKGKRYQETAEKLGFTSESLISIFERTLKRAIAFLEFMETTISQDHFREYIQKSSGKL